MELLKRFVRWLGQFAQRLDAWLTGSTEQSTTDDVAPGDVVPGGEVLAEPDLGLATTEFRRYKKRGKVLTNPENALFDRLRAEVGAEYFIFPKMRLGDVISLDNLPENRKYHNNQILCKHFDFVLCHLRSSEPLLAIELNDASHARYSRKASDDFKRSVCAEVGLPFLELSVGDRYPPGDLAHQIKAKLMSGPKASTGNT